MELLGSRLRDQRHLRTAVAAVLGRVAVQLDLDLGDRVQVDGAAEDLGRAEIVADHTVHRDGVPGIAATADIGRRRSQISAGGFALSGDRDAGQHLQHRDDITASHCQAFELRTGQRGRPHRALGLHEGGLGGGGDGFGQAAYLQLDRAERQLLARRKRDGRSLGGGKPRELDSHRVATGLDRGEHESASVAGRGRSRRARLLVNERHQGARHNLLAGIDDVAGNASRHRLRLSRPRAQEDGGAEHGDKASRHHATAPETTQEQKQASHWSPPTGIDTGNTRVNRMIVVPVITGRVRFATKECATRGIDLVDVDSSVWDGRGFENARDRGVGASICLVSRLSTGGVEVVSQRIQRIADASDKIVREFGVRWCSPELLNQTLDLVDLLGRLKAARGRCALLVAKHLHDLESGHLPNEVRTWQPCPRQWISPRASRPAAGVPVRCRDGEAGPLPRPQH